MQKFFEPNSIMIIGASHSPGKAGNVILENILANNFGGKIYPVNPAGGEIFGIKCYPSVTEVPEAPDLTLMAVPSSLAEETLLQCAAKGARALVVVNSGYAEVDNQGQELQTRLAGIAKEHDIRIMGPNTSGITSTPWKLCASIFPLGNIKRGRVSCIAQTGNFATHTMRWMLTGENFGVCRVAGLGNRIDIDEAELVEYFGEDKETGAILLYLEGFKDGKRFMEAARRSSRKKPIIALKAGRTGAGIRAVASHTASLAGNDRIVDSVLRQTGVVRIERYASLIDTAKFLSMQPVPKGNRLAVMTPSGAMGIIAADCSERLDLKIADLSERSYERLGDIYPSYIRVGNPIDIWGAASVHGIYKAYEIGLRIALEDPNVDMVLCILNLAPPTVNGQEKIELEKLKFIPELCREFPEKSVTVAISGDKNYYEEAKKYLEERSVPVFLPVEPGIEAMANAYYCRRYMESESHDN